MRTCDARSELGSKGEGAVHGYRCWSWPAGTTPPVNSIALLAEGSIVIVVQYFFRACALMRR